MCDDFTTILKIMERFVEYNRIHCPDFEVEVYYKIDDIVVHNPKEAIKVELTYGRYKHTITYQCKDGQWPVDTVGPFVEGVKHLRKYVASREAVSA